MITPGEVKRAKQRAVGGKKDRCRKGKSCSATCISGWKACLVEMPDMVSKSLTKAKNSIKSKAIDVIPGSRGERLRGQRMRYLENRKVLVSQIHRAIMGGSNSRASRLKDKLERIEKEIGSKLGVKKTKPIDPAGSTRYQIRWNNYFRAKGILQDKMKKEALKGDRTAYNRWERRLLALESKGGKLFSDKTLNKRGELWSSYRKAPREKSYNTAVRRIRDRMMVAAERGDRKEYVRMQKALQAMQNKAGRKLGVIGPEGAKREEEIWRNARLSVAKERVRDRMMEAIASNNRAAYDKLKAGMIRIGGSAGSDRRGEMWDTHQGLAHFVSRLNKAGIKDGREGVSGVKLVPSSGVYSGQLLSIESRVLNNALALNISPGSFSFTVNGSYLATGMLSRKEEVAIIREVRRQFDLVTKNIGEGTVLEVSAARGDGREKMRERGYEDYGFSPPDRTGQMFGRVRNGKVEPSDEATYNGLVKDTFSKT